MRNVLLSTIALTLFLSPASAMAQDRVGKFVLVEVDWYLGAIWINVDHVHRVMPCERPNRVVTDPDYRDQGMYPWMAEHNPGDTTSRVSD